MHFPWRRAWRALLGRSLPQVLPDIPAEAMEQVLTEGKEYSLFMRVNKTQVFGILAPVLIENQVDGGILTCHKIANTTVES